MLKIRFLKLILILPVVALFASGCSLNFNTGSSTSTGGGASDGGVYKSLDKGTTWQQKTLIQSVGRQRSFAGVDIISLAMDPGDNKAIYAGSSDSGLFYSYDGAGGWQIATGLGQISVTNVAVDPADKCVIYAASSNKLFKSDDCNRNWGQVYFDNDLSLKITALAIDNSNSANVFIGTSRGDIIKSSDRGASWRAVQRLDSQVDKLVISQNNTKIMFAGTASRGTYRSVDGGNKWESLSDKLKAFDNSTRFRDLVMVKSEKSAVFLATSYGLLKSADEGNNWSDIQLLTPEKEARINAIAVNQNNANEIYYTTNTTFYGSSDGGKNWRSKKLPTNRAGWRLLIDPNNPSVLYLAAKAAK